jgi:hypothetical protein
MTTNEEADKALWEAMPQGQRDKSEASATMESTTNEYAEGIQCCRGIYMRVRHAPPWRR